MHLAECASRQEAHLLRLLRQLVLCRNETRYGEQHKRDELGHRGERVPQVLVRLLRCTISTVREHSKKQRLPG